MLMMMMINICRTNFVTLRYQTDSWGTENNGFTLIITAFKNSQTFGCSDAFECDSFLCISSDLVCDNVSHCGHGEDEMGDNHCAGEEIMEMMVVVNTNNICRIQPVCLARPGGWPGGGRDEPAAAAGGGGGDSWLDLDLQTGQGETGQGATGGE